MHLGGCNWRDFVEFWRGRASSFAGEGRLGMTDGTGCSISNPLP